LATKAKPRKKAPDILDQQVVKGDYAKFVQQVKDKPMLYLGGAVFLLLCLLIGIFIQTSTSAGARSAVTDLARAEDAQDPGMRATQLEEVAAKDKKVAPDALYLAAESAYQAKDYARAKKGFEDLRAQYPDHKNVPDAVEGLAYIALNESQPDQAIAMFKEIQEKWPTSLAARRQHLNLAKVYESQDNLAEAAKEYQAQVAQFPGSSWEADAKDAIERLKQAHPELFPAAEPAPADAATPAAAAAPAPAPAEAAPVPEPVVTPTPENK
jgi:tetratricopeptide (TPR) repeat protein